jgi:hypothetical protein
MNTNDTLTAEITITADGIISESYTLNGAPISRDHYLAIQVAALDAAIAGEG